jgi:DNA-binding NtrC family response regulator
MKRGAVDFLTKPVNIERLEVLIQRALKTKTLEVEVKQLHERLDEKFSLDGIVGTSPKLKAVIDKMKLVAPSRATILIEGESGTGKELIAQAIHQASPRARAPFVAVHCAALSENLLESELFGHERGAFTGANQSRRGRFEEANGGTIFIDEIGDLALPLQAKLLRALQERKVERLGSNLSRDVDVRVICATNRNLEQMVREGMFREDLYFRISVVKIQMPALRERSDDIPLLAEFFLRTFAKTHKKQQRSMTPGYLNALSRHPWPGNVRELQNVIERSVVLANGSPQLMIEDLPPELQGLSASDELPTGSFHDALRAFKRDLVRSALAKNDGNKLQAAKELGISRCYLHRLLNQLNVAGGAEEEPELQEDLLEEAGTEVDVDVEAEAGADATEPAIGPVRLTRPASRIA